MRLLLLLFIPFLFLFVLLVATGSLRAQPQVCNMDSVAMTPICQDACIICDIDGFSGRHESRVVGSLPSDFCTFTVHNAQWIAFQAGSTFLRIEITVSNCTIGNGLELALYESTDCTNFRMISNCRGGVTGPVRPGTSAIIETNLPLVIGQYYYLAMDGVRADNCDWSFRVLQGSTELAPLSLTAPIEGPDRFCPGTLQRFTTEPETGAVFFDWTLDGQSIGDHRTPFVDLELNEIGTYDLCVTAKNACDQALPTCKRIVVDTIPATEVIDVFCGEDCYELDGNTYCETGVYRYTIPLDNGCDSTVILNLTRLETPVNDLMLNICQGDTLWVGDTPLVATGQYTHTLQTALQCDSIVNVDLNVIVCNIQTTFRTTSTTCAGYTDGTLSFTVEDGTPPFTFTWQHLQTGQAGSGNIPDLHRSTTLTDLPPGDIVVELADGFGNADVLLARVMQPLPLVLAGQLSNYNGFNTSCFQSTDGRINVLAEGGSPPYSYRWSSGDTSAVVAELPAGIYQLTLSDALGCIIEQDFLLTAPQPLQADVQFFDPNCEGLTTGRVEVQMITGGVAPFLTALNEASFSEQLSYQGLPPGTYELLLEDANACTLRQRDTLVAPTIPVLSGETIYRTRLGCEIPLELAVNTIPLQHIQWRDPSYLSCADCLSPRARPLRSGDNLLTVTSYDGCADSLLIAFDVETLRAFYAPNAFSPNRDGINDEFYLVGSKEVASIDLTIFDRWGCIVFQARNMAPQDRAQAWDGTTKGQTAASGVYAWVAEIRFIDGDTQVHSGDVVLLR